MRVARLEPVGVRREVIEEVVLRHVVGVSVPGLREHVGGLERVQAETGAVVVDQLNKGDLLGGVADRLSLGGKDDADEKDDRDKCGENEGNPGCPSYQSMHLHRTLSCRATDTPVRTIGKSARGLEMRAKTFRLSGVRRRGIAEGDTRGVGRPASAGRPIHDRSPARRRGGWLWCYQRSGDVESVEADRDGPAR